MRWRSLVSVRGQWRRESVESRLDDSLSRVLLSTTLRRIRRVGGLDIVAGLALRTTTEMKRCEYGRRGRHMRKCRNTHNLEALPVTTQVSLSR
jgi:hypothetical protein